MNQFISHSGKSRLARLTLLRMVLMTAIAAGFSLPGVALGQDRDVNDPDTFDDANSDSESYSFDSKYDANYGRSRPADSQRNRLTDESRPPGRHLMGFRLRVTDEGAVFVNAVYRGGLADRAGLRPGDKVLAIDGFEIGSRGDVARALREHSSGENVELIIARNGRTREIDVPLQGKWGDPAEAIAKGVEDLSSAIGKSATRLGGQVRRFSRALEQDLPRAAGDRPRASVRDPYDRFSDDSQGIQTDIDDETADHSGEPRAIVEIDVLPPKKIDSADLRDQQRRRNSRDQAAMGITIISTTDQGVVVKAVDPDGPADEAGLRSGDHILRVDGRKIDEPAQLVGYIERQQPGDEIEVQIDRNGRQRSVNLMLGEARNLGRDANHSGDQPTRSNRGRADRRQDDRRTPNRNQPRPTDDRQQGDPDFY